MDDDTSCSVGTIARQCLLEVFDWFLGERGESVLVGEGSEE